MRPIRRLGRIKRIGRMRRIKEPPPRVESFLTRHSSYVPSTTAPAPRLVAHGTNGMTGTNETNGTYGRAASARRELPHPPQHIRPIRLIRPIRPTHPIGPIHNRPRPAAANSAPSELTTHIAQSYPLVLITSNSPSHLANPGLPSSWNLPVRPGGRVRSHSTKHSAGPPCGPSHEYPIDLGRSSSDLREAATRQRGQRHARQRPRDRRRP